MGGSQSDLMAAAEAIRKQDETTKAFAVSLEGRGHTCIVMTKGEYPANLTWCGKEPCARK